MVYFLHCQCPLSKLRKFRIMYHQEPFNAGLGIQTEILIIYCYNCTLLLSLVEFGMFKHQGYPVKRWWHLVLTSSLSSASKSLHISHMVSLGITIQDFLLPSKEIGEQQTLPSKNFHPKSFFDDSKVLSMSRILNFQQECYYCEELTGSRTCKV